MPLRKGHSRAVVSDNIATLMHEGYPQKQAVAIALKESRKNPETVMNYIVDINRVGVRAGHGMSVKCTNIAQALRVVADEMTDPVEGDVIEIRTKSAAGTVRPMPGLRWVHEHKLWRQIP